MNATLYAYHGIQYTYADLQAAYTRRLDATKKAIDAEKYVEASEIIRTDVREYLPQIIDRQQTGDKNALTRHRKRGIIKAMRRYVRRWKRKQEGKKMKKYIVREFRTAPDGSEYETERYTITADELDETRAGLDELTGTAIDRYEIEEI